MTDACLQRAPAYGCGFGFWCLIWRREWRKIFALVIVTLCIQDLLHSAKHHDDTCCFGICGPWVFAFLLRTSIVHASSAYRFCLIERICRLLAHCKNRMQESSRASVQDVLSFMCVLLVRNDCCSAWLFLCLVWGRQNVGVRGTTKTMKTWRLECIPTCLLSLPVHLRRKCACRISRTSRLATNRKRTRKQHQNHKWQTKFTVSV